MRSFLCLRVIATRCCRLLQTLVQTDWLRRSIEVTVPDFQVVLPRRLLRVAHPSLEMQQQGKLGTLLPGSSRMAATHED